MSTPDFSSWLNARREEISRRAMADKDSQRAVGELVRLFERLDEQERELAVPVVTSWATSVDASERFDGLALIDRFQVQGALPALRRLAEQLEADPAPSAPYDRARVDRIIGRLTSAPSGGTG